MLDTRCTALLFALAQIVIKPEFWLGAWKRGEAEIRFADFWNLICAFKFSYFVLSPCHPIWMPVCALNITHSNLPLTQIWIHAASWTPLLIPVEPSNPPPPPKKNWNVGLLKIQIPVPLPTKKTGMWVNLNVFPKKTSYVNWCRVICKIKVDTWPAGVGEFWLFAQKRDKARCIAI